MKSHLEAYRQSREVLLSRISKELSIDERFIAAWLTGSYSRNDADELSDLDITVVVAEPYRELLCAKQEQMSHKTTEERLALISKFGKPVLIHENNHNAPDGGTFTFVLYADSALMVDWVMMPHTNAERPYYSVLLFEKGNIPVSPPPVPEELEESQRTVAEIWAFFWMMAAITIKYIVRRDLVYGQNWIVQLHGLIREIERRIQRVPWQYSYVRGPSSQLQSTREMQLDSLRQLINRMQQLAPKIRGFTQSELIAPLAEIEFLLSLAEE